MRGGRLFVGGVVLPSMHCSQRSIWHVLERRKVKAIKVEMKNAEVVRTLSNLSQMAR
jgi:hypothetical protein